nr:MAG TPA: hypothetical protein [Bacteriophage sp.]
MFLLPSFQKLHPFYTSYLGYPWFQVYIFLRKLLSVPFLLLVFPT